MQNTMVFNLMGLAKKKYNKKKLSAMFGKGMKWTK